MKVNRIQVEEFGVCRNLHLGQFRNALNIVLGTTGTGKTTLRRMIRGLLYGKSQIGLVDNAIDQNLTRRNQLEVNWNGQDAMLQREPNNSGFRLNPLAANPVHPLSTTRLDVAAEFYDTIYNLSFHDTKDILAKSTRQLGAHFDLPAGSMQIRDESVFLRWQHERTELESERLSIQNRMDALAREQQEIQTRIRSIEEEHQRQLAEADREIARIDAQLQQLDLHAIESLLNQLKDEAAHLRQFIANEENVVEYVAPVEQPNSDYASLYQRLDEIDHQIRRWRRVQNEIQTQRIHLREEMLAWNDLTLDSDEHPYHNARSILISLESIVDQTEHQLSHAQNAPVSQDNIRSLTQNVSGLCQKMREDIYNLCQELGQQYKHIRHKAAVAELKQLRRCYKEIGDNTELLVRRRKDLLSEIQHIDPAGAAAIQRADHQFCQCAQHEGYLEARRRYVNDLLPKTTHSVLPTVVRKDLTYERNRLAEVEHDIDQNSNRVSNLLTEKNSLENQRNEWLLKRDRDLYHANLHNLNSRIGEIEREASQLRAQRAEIEQRLQFQPRVETMAHPMLAMAAGYLSELTAGELTGVWLSADRHDWAVQQREGRVFSVQQVSRGQMDQVLLALVLASAVQMKSQTVELPLILDDVFANVDEHASRKMFDVLSNVAVRENVQMIVMAKHNELDHLDKSRTLVLELPQTTVTPAPYFHPEPETQREPFGPPRQAWAPNVYVDNRSMEVQRLVEDVEVRYPFTGSSQITDTTPRRVITSPPTNSPPTNSTPIEVAQHIAESSRLTDLRFIDSVNLRKLNDMGYLQVTNLLDVDPDELPDDLVRAGFSRDQINRWQAQAWLMVCIPGINSLEAKLLYAAGIVEPEQLDTTGSQQLEQRLHRYLSSREGSRFATGGFTLTQDRLGRWYRSLEQTRSRWRGNDGYSRRSRRRARPNRNQTSHTDNRLGVYTSREPQNENAFSRSRQRNSFDDNRQTRDRSSRTRQKVERQMRSVPDSVKSDASSALRFYLNTKDDLEAAPSIGPKTAERFAKIGVISVDDFLKQTAESMATKLNYKRISAKVIRQWQQQSRLVCRIPNLRGHDAQLLVACDVTEPEDLAQMNAEALFAKVGPFAESKEGQKIIRSGKKPDLEEVTDWITWASKRIHGRLQAA